MVTSKKQMASLVVILFLFSALASADSMVYVVTSNLQFGTVDLNTGAFAAIGPGVPVLTGGLVPAPNGSLLTLGSNGDLYSINPSTGSITSTLATGLGDCSTPASPCGLTSANQFGELGGTIYATDYANNLFTVNPVTGNAKLVGSTQIPAITIVPFTSNPDGTLNIFDSSLFSADGNLYATQDTGRLNPATFTVTPVMAAQFYRIDPSTGLATFVANTSFGLDAFASVNGSLYTFDNATGQILTIDLANGDTTAVGSLSPSAGLIFGATPTPEPASLILLGTGLIGLGLLLRRKFVAQGS